MDLGRPSRTRAAAPGYSSHAWCAPCAPVRSARGAPPPARTMRASGRASSYSRKRPGSPPSVRRPRCPTFAHRPGIPSPLNDRAEPGAIPWGQLVRRGIGANVKPTDALTRRAQGRTRTEAMPDTELPCESPRGPPQCRGLILPRSPRVAPRPRPRRRVGYSGGRHRWRESAAAVALSPAHPRAVERGQ